MKNFDHQFADWVSLQAPEHSYDYVSNTNCALCHFLRASGIAEKPLVGGMTWRVAVGHPDNHELSELLQEALCEEPRTFGALAARLAAAS